MVMVLNMWSVMMVLAFSLVKHIIRQARIAIIIGVLALPKMNSIDTLPLDIVNKVFSYIESPRQLYKVNLYRTRVPMIRTKELTPDGHDPDKDSIK